MRSTALLLVAAGLTLTGCDRYIWLVVSPPSLFEAEVSDDDPVRTLLVTAEASDEGRQARARIHAVWPMVEVEAEHYQGCAEDCDLRVEVRSEGARSRSIRPDPGYAEIDSIDLPTAFENCPARGACSTEYEVEVEFEGEGLMELRLAGIMMLQGYGAGRRVAGEEMTVRFEVLD